MGDRIIMKLDIQKNLIVSDAPFSIQIVYGDIEG